MYLGDEGSLAGRIAGGSRERFGRDDLGAWRSQLLLGNFGSLVNFVDLESLWDGSVGLVGAIL